MFAQPHAESGDGDPLAHLARTAPTSEVAAGQLIRATQVDVWRLCRALSDDDSADDLVQETYLRVLQALPTFRGESLLRVWILAIARRTAADHVRKAVRQRRLDAVLRRRHVEVDAGLDSTLETDELLQQLPAPQHAAFVLTQVLGLDYAEAASVVGCPIGTIRSRVARARDTLTRLYDDS